MRAREPVWTARLIEESREALESSRVLLEHTHPIRPADLVARWSAQARTILFVDDDDLVRRAVSEIIEGNGLRALAAKSATERHWASSCSSTSMCCLPTSSCPNGTGSSWRRKQGSSTLTSN
jgi:hypothetical protein